MSAGWLRNVWFCPLTHTRVIPRNFAPTDAPGPRGRTQVTSEHRCVDASAIASPNCTSVKAFTRWRWPRGHSLIRESGASRRG